MNNDFNKSLEDLENLLEESWNLPIANNKYIINGEKLKNIISDIKLNIPMEMRKAREVLDNKDKLVSKTKEESDAMMDKAKKNAEMMLVKARKSAEGIIEKAKIQAETMVDEQEIMSIAKERAADIVERAKSDAIKMRNVTLSYVDGVLNESQRSLEKALDSVRQARKSYNGDNN